MPRPKGSTNKKKEDKPIKPTYTDFIAGISEPIKNKIELFGHRFNHEDQNELVDKVNEIIAYINK